MNRDQIARGDFPAADAGYDRASVDAHLAAVAAWTDSLQAQITALEVERDALRRQAGPTGRPTDTDEAGAEPDSESSPDPDPALKADRKPVVRREPADDEVSARLVATRLALEGSGREEIVAKLADTYELEDPAAIADDVLNRVG